MKPLKTITRAHCANGPAASAGGSLRTGQAGEEPAPITEDWLREVGFKWHELERFGGKHWLLWLGDAMGDGRMVDFEDFGIELASHGPTDERWFCWLRSDTAGRYHRFIHARYLRFQHELVAMIEGLTGQAWDPANNFYGSMRTPSQAARLREEHARLDQRMMRERAKWSDVEKDDSRGRALPEHLEAAVKAGKAT